MSGYACKAPEGETVSRVVVWGRILEPIPRLLAGKNEDYDDSYTRARAEDGPMSLVVMLRHKFNRLRNMALRKEHLPRNESYRDTLRDIIGYCVLEMEYLEMDARKSLPGQVSVKEMQARNFANSIPPAPFIEPESGR